MFTFKTTNKPLFDAKVVDVDTSGLKTIDSNGTIAGTIEIETLDDRITFTGGHGKTDYEDEYGFVIAPVN
jgi:hypothetical protein